MKRVFVDVDTQYDFLMPAGALPVPSAESIIPVIARLNGRAQAGGHLVISTVDAHTENDIEFGSWPPHCIAGTLGQQKPSTTLLDHRITLPASAAAQDLTGISQLVVEKQATSWSDYANWQSVIAASQGEEFILYGVVTEICVMSAAKDLLDLGKRVLLVSDAVMHLADEPRAEFLTWFARRGGRLIKSEEVG